MDGPLNVKYLMVSTASAAVSFPPQKTNSTCYFWHLHRCCLAVHENIPQNYDYISYFMVTSSTMF